jgi:hypothetical protein
MATSIIYGTVAKSVAYTQNKGYRVQNMGNGEYSITFIPPFKEIPAI